MILHLDTVAYDGNLRPLPQGAHRPGFVADDGWGQWEATDTRATSCIELQQNRDEIRKKSRTLKKTFGSGVSAQYRLAIKVSTAGSYSYN